MLSLSKRVASIARVIGDRKADKSFKKGDCLEDRYFLCLCILNERWKECKSKMDWIGKIQRVLLRPSLNVGILPTDHGGLARIAPPWRDSQDSFSLSYYNSSLCLCILFPCSFFLKLLSWRWSKITGRHQGDTLPFSVGGRYLPGNIWRCEFVIVFVGIHHTSDNGPLHSFFMRMWIWRWAVRLVAHSEGTFISIYCKTPIHFHLQLLLPISWIRVAFLMLSSPGSGLMFPSRNPCMCVIPSVMPSLRFRVYLNWMNACDSCHWDVGRDKPGSSGIIFLPQYFLSWLLDDGTVVEVVTSLSFPDSKWLFSIQLLVNLWGAKGERYGHPMKAVVNKRDPGTTKLDSINCFRDNTTQNKLFKALCNRQYYSNSKIHKISRFRVLPNPRARISIPFARRPQQV